MPTTRSKYKYVQFEKLFQAMAHEIAIEAVTNLVTGGEGLVIKGYNKRKLSEVKAGNFHFRFYAKHLSFSGPTDNKNPKDTIDFDIEEKFYGSSAHCSKISFYSPEIKNEDVEVEDRWGYMEHPVDHKKTDAEKQRRQKRIDEFLEQFMKIADVKIEPRLSLKDCKK